MRNEKLFSKYLPWIFNINEKNKTREVAINNIYIQYCNPGTNIANNRRSRIVKAAIIRDLFANQMNFLDHGRIKPDFRIETEPILPSSSDMMELNVFFIALPFYDLQNFGKNLTLQSEQNRHRIILPGVALSKRTMRMHMRKVGQLCSKKHFNLLRFQPSSQSLSSPHPKGSEGRKTLVQAGHVPPKKWE